MIVLFGIGLSKAMVLSCRSSWPLPSAPIRAFNRPKVCTNGWRTPSVLNFYTLIHVAIPTSLPMMILACGLPWVPPDHHHCRRVTGLHKGNRPAIQQSRGLFRPDIIIVGMIAIGVTDPCWPGCWACWKNVY